MNWGFYMEKVSRPAIWLFFITITALLLGYQTVLLNATVAPTQTEQLMIWLASRGILVLAITYGYVASRWYGRLIDRFTLWTILWLVFQIALLLSVGAGIYLITGDSTFVGLGLASMIMVALRNVRGRWVSLLVVVLMLNLPLQVGRWYQANRNLPLPTSEQVNVFEQNQRQQRQQRATEIRNWAEHDYAALIRYHDAVWTQRLMSDIQTGRWSSLIGMVLLGMMLRHWRGFITMARRNLITVVAGVCALTTLLELTSGRTYVTTLHLYSDSLRYPGYYMFDVPAALYLTVAEAASLSMAILIGLGIWLLMSWANSNGLMVRRRALRRKLSLRRLWSLV